MNRLKSRIPVRRPRVSAAFLLAAAGLLLAFASVGAVTRHVAVEAHAGLDQASAAARVWAEDAALVYLENDEDLDPAGASARWGYLFYSPTTKKARGYSVRDGRILVAEDLEMTFAAPPVASEWIDSGAALRAADENAGTAFRRDQLGVVSSMLLTRGAFHDGDPNQTTWTIVYTSPRAPSLFVVVDAAEGKVRKTWRG
jgi:hypothetical protein